MAPPTHLRTRRRPARSGRAALLLVGVLIAGAVVAALILGGGDGTRGPQDRAPVVGDGTAGAGPGGDGASGTPASASATHHLGAVSGAPVGRASTEQAPALEPPDGRPIGILRGQVEVPQGVTFPERWTLVLEPSRFMTGSEHAEERLVEVEGSATFVVENLPLAGYDIFPTAPGFSARRAPVLLHPGREQIYVVLHMEPAAFVDGRVLDTNGGVVEGLAITLEEPASLRRTTVTTDHAGFWRIDAVPDGDYRLLVGPPDAPVLEPRTIAVRPPSLAVPTIEVAALETLRLTVTDAIGTPVAGARVRGSGEAGGYVDGVTDARGELLIPLLPAGRLRLRALHESAGRGFLSVDLVADGGIQTAVLELTP